MSGGGGGNTRFDGTPGGNSQDCEALVIQTPLNSPDPAVVKTLSKGDRLEVRKETTPGGVVRIEVVANGKVAGSVTSAQLMLLISCINAGTDFVAIVTNTPSGGLVS